MSHSPSSCPAQVSLAEGSPPPTSWPEPVSPSGPRGFLVPPRAQGSPGTAGWGILPGARRHRGGLALWSHQGSWPTTEVPGVPMSLRASQSGLSLRMAHPH